MPSIPPRYHRIHRVVVTAAVAPHTMSLSCRKKLAYIYQAKVKKNDSHYHCIWGKFEPPREGFLSKLDHSASTSANGAESDSWSGDQNHSELESSFEERELARNSSTSELESDGDGNRSPQEFGREVTEVEDQVLQNVGNVEAKPVRFQQQQLDDETHALQLELGSMLDAVQETESKMGEMSALNHLMSTHVLQQAQRIEHLYEQAVEATMNVELGNKELLQAIQRNSSSRTFLLLFLFVLTFSVLFLDWYS